PRRGVAGRSPASGAGARATRRSSPPCGRPPAADREAPHHPASIRTGLTGMRLPPFDLAVPETLAEAVGLLAAGPGESRVIGGGTGLLPTMRLRAAPPGRVVSPPRHCRPRPRSTDDGGPCPRGALHPSPLPPTH